ncbi:hypothetical protein HID58_041255, partial [Brassica napus]
ELGTHVSIDKCSFGDLSFDNFRSKTTKIIPCDDFSKKLKNNYFMEFKEILGRQYEKECLVDIIGEVVNVEPLKYIIATGKCLTKLELITIRDTM